MHSDSVEAKKCSRKNTVEMEREGKIKIVSDMWVLILADSKPLD